MTFLAGDPLVPGGRDGPWARPWAFRCDDCGRCLPYGVTLRLNERRTSRDQAREAHPGAASAAEGRNHVCGDCEGFTEQLGLGLS